MNRKIIVILVIFIVLIILIPSLIYIKTNEPKRIYVNDTLIHASKENQNTSQGPIIYQTSNISVNNKNMEFAVANWVNTGLVCAGQNNSHNINYNYTLNLSSPTKYYIGCIGMAMFLLKSNINNLGIKMDSAQLINTTHNVMYNESLDYGIGNQGLSYGVSNETCGIVKGSGASIGMTPYNMKDNESLFSMNPLLTYTIVISFTLYKDYFIGSSNLGTYNIYLTHFPIKIID